MSQLNIITRDLLQAKARLILLGARAIGEGMNPSFLPTKLDK